MIEKKRTRIDFIKNIENDFYYKIINNNSKFMRASESSGVESVVVSSKGY